MTEFLQALLDPAAPFLRNAFVAGILASVAFGIMGAYVVARRITYIAGAIAHCVLGGLGAAVYCNGALGIAWIQPMHGAIAAALLAALVIGIVSQHGRQREDALIGALWAIGMAVGLLFFYKTPGYVDPMSYLFGDILLISKGDLRLILGLDAVVVALALLFYNKFLAVCFDEEFAELRGVNTRLYYLLLLCLTALTVVLLVPVVGIVMVIALLTLPAAVAAQFSLRIWQMMALSVALCMAFTACGLATSYAWDLPSGSTIILFGGGAYVGVVCVRRLRRRGQG